MTPIAFPSLLMDMEERQKNLRKKLDLLGFRQPLPVAGVGLVSALVEDLLKTTDSLKLAKKEINQLLQVLTKVSCILRLY